jgi:hypothetical protein
MCFCRNVGVGGWNKACIQSIVCVVYEEIPNRLWECVDYYVLFALFTRNFFLCLHVDIISILLLSKQFWFSFKIQNFSSKHKLHLLNFPLNKSYIYFYTCSIFMVLSALFAFRIHKPTRIFAPVNRSCTLVYVSQFLLTLKCDNFDLTIH